MTRASPSRGALGRLTRSCATQPFGEAIGRVRLDEVVDRVQIERADRVAVVRRREDHGGQRRGRAASRSSTLKTSAPGIRMSSSTTSGRTLGQRARQLVADRALRTISMSACAAA